MLDDNELARRSILGFGEMVSVLARSGNGTASEIRRPHLLGGRIVSAADNPWFDAAVVPLGSRPPIDEQLFPHCLWTVVDAVPGRVEDPAIATPCLGLSLDQPPRTSGASRYTIDVPSLLQVGDLNERAYGHTGPAVFTPLIAATNDRRIRTHGIRDQHRFVCVAVTLTLNDDLSIHFVATDPGHRRVGLATALLESLLARAREARLRSATLQASADGLGVYERLGFRRVATLRGFVRHPPLGPREPAHGVGMP